RSLTGASFEDSVRLEPTQIAGFIQSYRNLIPESIAGSTSGAQQEVMGLGLDWPFRPGSYLGIEAVQLRSDVSQQIGVYDVLYDVLRYVPSSTLKTFDYTERSVRVELTHQFTD